MPTLRINNNNQNVLYFITLTIIEWIDIFTKPEYFKIITDSLIFCRTNKGLLLFEYVIMPNHLHLIVRAKEGFNLSQIISDFKKHTTRQILKQLDQDNRKYIKTLLENSYSKKHGYTNQIWQRENYPEPIESDNFLNTKINYIHNNPVKKKYIEQPEHWIYSSARNRLSNDDSIIYVDNWE